MTDEQKKQFVEDYYAELSRLYGIQCGNVQEEAQRANAIKNFNDGASKIMSTFNEETEARAKAIEADARGEEAQARAKEADARLIEANARTREVEARFIEANARSREAEARVIEAQARVDEAEAKKAEVAVTRKQGWVRIGVDVLKAAGAFLLFRAVYNLESEGGWYNRNKESSRLTTDFSRENLLR